MSLTLFIQNLNVSRDEKSLKEPQRLNEINLNTNINDLIHIISLKYQLNKDDTANIGKIIKMKLKIFLFFELNFVIIKELSYRGQLMARNKTLSHYINNDTKISEANLFLIQKKRPPSLFQCGNFYNFSIISCYF
jgi:hypothetical protein